MPKQTSKTIRTATQQDLPTIQQIYHNTWLETSQNEYEPETQQLYLENKKENYWLNLYKNKNTQLHVAEYKNQIIGFTQTTIPDNQTERVTLERIYITKLNRRHGIATLLLENFHHITNNRNAQLKVYQTNQNAQNLYQKTGWWRSGIPQPEHLGTQTGTRENWYWENT